MKWLLPVGVGAALLFSACGDSSKSATTSAPVNLDTTNYHTLPPTQSTAPPVTLVPVTNPGDTTPPGGTTAGETTYKIQKGDVEFTVANKYGITLDALRLANADTPGYSAFYPGLVIKIPAGATVPTANSTPDTTQSTTPGQTTTTLKGGGSNCAEGTYTIKAGDLPGTVAKNFDVTVAQLAEANANTKGYKGFIVGTKIIIPAKAGCTG
jgi:LysM repeat protein